MIKTTIKITQMDCGCEERMVRMKLAEFGKISSMSADIPKREFVVIHDETEAEILTAINSLNLGSSLLKSEILDINFSQECGENLAMQSHDERKLLLYVLLINFAFFVIELGFGYVANSMGLVADSLDMLSDAVVYAMAFFAVFATLKVQKNVARMAGVFQLFLALFGFFEVVRRFFGDGEANFIMMMVVSFFALLANWACLRILSKTQSDKPHIKASQIFTSNDIIINIGVIVAGVLVWASGSNLPDLVVGAIVFVLVCKGAMKILALSR